MDSALTLVWQENIITEAHTNCKAKTTTHEWVLSVTNSCKTIEVRRKHANQVMTSVEHG